LARYTRLDRAAGAATFRFAALLAPTGFDYVKVWQLRCANRNVVLALGSDFAPCSGANRPPVGKLPNFDAAEGQTELRSTASS
jgi:hypothetical protein